MVNEIKIDKSITDYTPKIPPKQDTHKPTVFLKEKSEIKVTNHLRNLVNLLVSEEFPPEDTTKVKEMKRRIDANDYQIDLDALSSKLLNMMSSHAKDQ